MLNIIYYLIIGPIETLVEITYCIMHRIIGNSGVAIIAVSLVVQTLILPLYKRADKLQDEERQRQKEMAHWVTHIKKTFTGDECLMMLSAYYKERGYKQWYAVISSASILLQIPFFIAAYHFLSNLTELQGQSFWFIRDLSQPDMSVSLMGNAINILPILMTLINIGSGIVYTRSYPLKEKLQVYGLALVFLILLYNSPSGLVLYWTMNNVYSLGKNIVMKFFPVSDKDVEVKEKNDNKEMGAAEDLLRRLFILEGLFLAVYIGALMPLNVVSSSATEFINKDHGPMYLVACNFAVYAGLFMLWSGIFYAFMTKEVRKFFVLILTLVCGAAIVDYMVFSRDMGVISPLLGYYDGLKYVALDKILNLAVLVVICLLLAFLYYKKTNLLKMIMPVLVISTLFLCFANSISVIRQVNAYNKGNESQESLQTDQVIKLSKNGTNVIVLFMDRAISGLIPYVFKENPEIASMFEGFTYYPNTLSYGRKTIFGAPALYGGYEYCPEKLNDRSDELLKDKHNEALLVLPKIFSDNGYDVVVTDPPFAGTYSYALDYSMYDSLTNTKAYKLGASYLYEYADKYLPSYQKRQESLMKYHCLMKSLPLALQKIAYSEGGYFSKIDFSVDIEFLGAYSVLLKLNDITACVEDSSNNFLLFDNETVHSPSILKTPEYEPAEGLDADDIDYSYYADSDIFTIEGVKLRIENEQQAAHYQSTVAAMRRLGYWFSYLKQNDCWDNTRIIIVSDHGHDLKNFDELVVDEDLDIEAFNPLLMVKDFYDVTYKVSDEFMTNADVPTIALEGLIENPLNPYTGHRIDGSEKNEEQSVISSRQWNPDPTAYTFDADDAIWYKVMPGDIFDHKNWSKISD